MTKSPSSHNRLLEHPAALCNAVRRIALEAGTLTLDYFDDAGYEGADIKDDGSPVTLADRAAEALIEKALADLVPGVPMIGEEAVSEGRIPDISAQDYFWMVDPLDGTKEFVSGGSDYTVNIALIKGGRPVLGVVYAPVPGILYAGHGPGTALRYSDDTGTERPIRTRVLPPQGLTVVASRRHGDSAAMQDFLSSYKVAKLLKRGSSLKICVIAEGKADLYPRMGPTCEWDTAAADAVLQAAGGQITDLDGGPFQYGGHRGKFLNPHFLARSQALIALDDNHS